MEGRGILEKEEKRELAIILVSHNCRPYLQTCLASLEPGLSSLSTEVIVVDNNSSDGTQAQVERFFPKVRLIQNRENLGYARANNQGIRGSDSEFVLLLNPDTMVPGGAISSLLDELKKRPNAGAIGPRLVNETGLVQVSFGKKVSFLAEMKQKLFLNPYYQVRLRFSARPREVGWLSGACLLLRRQALEEAGLFDENFFLYFEDIDLCYRLRERGYRLIFFPGVEVVHRGGATTSNQRRSSRLEYRRSQVYFYEKHNSRLSLFLLKVYLRLVFAFSTAFLVPGKDEKSRWREKMRTILKR